MNSTGKSAKAKPVDAQSAAVIAAATQNDADLAVVLTAWADLPAKVRKAILATVRKAAKG